MITKEQAKNLSVNFKKYKREIITAEFFDGWANNIEELINMVINADISEEHNIPQEEEK